MKVILLAFANSYIAPLPNLTSEDETIYNMLQEQSGGNGYQVHRISNATIENVNNALRLHRDNLAIFHYSGHAGIDRLLLNEEHANANGIASQLKYSAQNGVLEMVVLNGCSTCGQVALLKAAGVPVVVSTNAPVGDRSATAFSIRFWTNLVRYYMTIEDAFEDAIGPAQTATEQDLSEAYHRHLATEEGDCEDSDKGVWRLDSIADNNVKRNPIPYKNNDEWEGEIPQPNDELTETLFESLHEAGNPEIIPLWDLEKVQNKNVTKSTKQSTCLNNIPYPIGIHLQRLLSPQPLDKNLQETTNNFGIPRLKQIAQLYQTTTEFLCIIMIAQLWELIIKLKDAFFIEPFTEKALNEYINLDEEKRKTYNHIPLIQLIRGYLENYSRDGKYSPFLDEQDSLKHLFEADPEFRQACDFLYNLRKQAVNNRINTDRIKLISYEAEKHLCSFLKPLGFIHRYNLVSVQKIDILKFRRSIRPDNLDFKHRVVRCMQSMGEDEFIYYYMPSFVDNWSVMLIKTETEEVIDNKKKKFEVVPKDYLNLSPFIIDRNSFDEKATLPYIMFFKGIGNGKAGIYYQWVRDPLNLNAMGEYFIQDRDKYEPILLQFEAFQKMIQPKQRTA